MSTNESDAADPPTVVEREKRFFDLGEAGGVNESERILTKLCQRSFLRL